MPDNVEVKIVADASDAKSGMGDASSSISASLQGIQKSLDNLGSTSRKTSTDVKSHAVGMAAAFAALHENVRVRFGSINNIFEQFSSKLAIVGAALAGGALFGKSISEMLKLEDAVRGLVITFGMSTVAATQQAVALKLAGISADTYEQMGQRVGRVLKTQSEEFDRLGVVTKDATGNLLPMGTILQNVYQRMQDFKAGTDQTEFALSTVGRNAKDFASDMERLGAASERAASLMAELNIQMGPDRIAAIEKYRQDLNAFGVVMDDIGDKVGGAALPGLEKLAAWFGEYGPRAAEIIIGALKVLIAVLQSVGTFFALAAIQVTGAFDAMVVSAKSTGQTLLAVFTQNWAAIPAIVSDANAKIGAINKNTADEVTRTWKEATDKIKAMWTDAANGQGMHDRGVGQSGGLPGSGKEHFTPKPTGAGGGESALAGMKAELDDMNLANGAFLQLSKQNEMEFWQEKLALVQGNGVKEIKLREEINREILRARNASAEEEYHVDVAKFERMLQAAKNDQAQQMSIANAYVAFERTIHGEDSTEYQKAYETRTKIEQEWAKKKEAIEKDASKHVEEMAGLETQLEQEGLNQQLALRQITVQQKLAVEVDFENKLYAIKLKAMQDELAILTQGTLAYQQQAEKIEALEVQHQIKLTQLANQAVLDRQQYALQADQKIESSFSTLFSDLATGTKTIKQAFLDFFKSISDGLSKIAADQVAKQLFGAGSSGGSFLSGITSKIFGGGATGAAGAGGDAAHTAAVAADTAATTADTTVKTAQVTIAGTLTASFAALVAAANAAAAAMTAMGASGGAGGGLGGLFGGGGFGDVIPSFAVGTAYVPQDSLAMVHKGEKIIPAAYNAGGGGGFAQSNQVHIHLAGPVDTRTMDQISRAVAHGTRRADARG